MLFLSMAPLSHIFSFFFFNDTATTEIYTLSLHDALPILTAAGRRRLRDETAGWNRLASAIAAALNTDRKSTRLNSSHQIISYAVFCLKKKKEKRKISDIELAVKQRSGAQMQVQCRIVSYE